MNVAAQFSHCMSWCAPQLLWYHHEKPLPGHVTAERFETMMKLRALESLAEPGEGVGMLAAQVTGVGYLYVVYLYL